MKKILLDTNSCSALFGGKDKKLIPTNDIWIAAQAIETGSILVSFDRHFSNIVGLRLWESN